MIDKRIHQLIKSCVYVNAGIAITASIYFFLSPCVFLLLSLSDSVYKTGKISSFVYRSHTSLTSRYEFWARERVASGKAETLDVQDISGTEWPMFSSVYYLWLTEALQLHWQSENMTEYKEPISYSHEAVLAAINLIIDPKHAHWVKQHWGDDYLMNENVFYRMLYIAGLSSYQNLTGDRQYQEVLRAQVEDLAAEFDDSPLGLLDDYPGQCYLVDILPAIAMIDKADKLLGSDHSNFISRSLRAFEGRQLDVMTGLPVYSCDSKTGYSFGPARGVGMSYMLIWSPQLWPQRSDEWYSRYQKYFWQQNAFLAGFREFPKSYSYPGWAYTDVDAGPIIAGFGTAASAFGIGAARANGYMEHAYPLTMQALVASWPLPNGTLLMPRLLSNLSDAPYIGELALLFSLSRIPIGEEIYKNDKNELRLPISVYLGISVYALFSILILVYASAIIKSWRPVNLMAFYIPLAKLQVLLWLVLLMLACLAYAISQPILCAIFILFTQLLPKKRSKSKRSKKSWKLLGT